MANLDDLNYPSIIDMQTDDAIDLLRQIRLSRRTPEKKSTRTTTKQTREKVTTAVDAGMAAELLRLLGGEDQ